jgi:hypothetical protein
VIRIEQVRENIIPFYPGHIYFIFDPERLYDRDFEPAAKAGRFVAVQLHHGQTALPDYPGDRALARVAENPDLFHAARQHSYDPAGLLRTNIPRALFEENKPSAFAPALTAPRASSRFVIPQILTFVMA